jgi:hypothetical protein
LEGALTTAGEPAVAIRSSAFERFGRAASRTLLCLALFVAPWAYGGTTSETIRLINSLAGEAVICWACFALAARRSPHVPTTPVVATLGLLAIGWSMAANAHWIFDPEYSLFAPVQSWAATMPGSVDRAISLATMVRMTVLFGAMLCAADLSQDQQSLLHLWWTVALAGGSIALLGLVQKASGAETIFWQATAGPPVKTFFATYYYHANAGAFLNLVLPLVIGMTVRVFSKRANPWTRSLSLILTTVVLMSVFANTSRMSQFVAVLLLLALTVRFAPLVARRLWRSERQVAIVGITVALITAGAIAAVSRLEEPLQRWSVLRQQLPINARWEALRAALPAARDAGILGFGPGTFRVVFPYYSGGLSDPSLEWRFLHQDYVQTAIEWGLLGSAIWAVLLFGGIAAAVGGALTERASRWSARQRLLLPLTVLAIGGAAVHALVDFPLQIASIQLYVAVYLGICWGSVRWDTAGRRTLDPDPADRGKAEIATPSPARHR